MFPPSLASRPGIHDWCDLDYGRGVVVKGEGLFAGQFGGAVTDAIADAIHGSGACD